jgi:hypothetical protein
MGEQFKVMPVTNGTTKTACWWELLYMMFYGSISVLADAAEPSRVTNNSASVSPNIHFPSIRSLSELSSTQIACHHQLDPMYRVLEWPSPTAKMQEPSPSWWRPCLTLSNQMSSLELSPTLFQQTPTMGSSQNYTLNMEASETTIHQIAMETSL